MSSTPDLVQESGVIESSLSDHFPVYMVLNLKLPKQPRSYITVRSLKNYNPMLFTADLVSKHETLLQSIFSESDVNSKLSKLKDAYYPPYKLMHQLRQSEFVIVHAPISLKI